MGGVSSADQMPGGTSSGTVEQSPTATQSDPPLTPDRKSPKMPKTEVAQKPVIVQQLTALASNSQILAGCGVIIETSNLLKVIPMKAKHKPNCISGNQKSPEGHR